WAQSDAFGREGSAWSLLADRGRDGLEKCVRCARPHGGQGHDPQGDRRPPQVAPGEIRPLAAGLSGVPLRVTAALRAALAPLSAFGTPRCALAYPASACQVLPFDLAALWSPK